MIDMKVSLQSKNLWVQSNIQNVAFCPEANLVSGDGVSIFLPLSVLAASSEFIKSLLIPCCNSCGGVVRISLPSVTGETLILASQILLSGETENMNKDNIDDILVSVEELLLVLLGFKVQLGIKLCRVSDQDSPIGCIKDNGSVDIINEKEFRFQDNALNGPEKTYNDDMNNNHENPNLDIKKKVKILNKDPDPQTKVDDDIGIRLCRKSCSSSFSSSCSSSSKQPSLNPSPTRYMLRERRSTNEKLGTISTHQNSVACVGANAMEDISKSEKVVSDIVDERNPGKNIKIKSHPNISQTSAYLQCQDCDESYRFKVSLIKHQVEEHFYEELENMFVEEFLRCSVCCKMDFKNTGLGMFIRHKAESHLAIELLRAKISMTDTDD